MFLGILDLGPAKYILKNASLSTDWLTSIVTSLAGEHAQCLSALLHIPAGRSFKHACVVVRVTPRFRMFSESAELPYLASDKCIFSGENTQM